MTKNNIVPVVEMDLTGYKIIDQVFPFKEGFYRLYQGILEECIQHFETHYGKIDGIIYHDKDKKMVGITGSQVVAKGEK